MSAGWICSRTRRRVATRNNTTRGFPKDAKPTIQDNHVSTFMHSEISTFSRKGFTKILHSLMQTRLLIEIATIRLIIERIRVVLHGWISTVQNRGTNKQEVDAIEVVLRDFINWARENKPPFMHRRPDCWEIALLFLIRLSGADCVIWCGRLQVFDLRQDSTSAR